MHILTTPCLLVCLPVTVNFIGAGVTSIFARYVISHVDTHYYCIRNLVYLDLASAPPPQLTGVIVYSLPLIFSPPEPTV